MKTCFCVCLALAAIVPARAQMLRPRAVNGAVVGGIAGAIIGHNSGDLRHNAWRGAAIGAGAGLLLGTLAADAEDRCNATQVPMPDGARTYLYRTAPTPDVYEQDDTAYLRPNYAGRGLFWGGLLGAVIGNNSGGLRHNGWRGAAYGAAAGYLLGAIADHRATERAAAVTVVSTAPAPSTEMPALQPAAAPAQPATPPSSMAAANSLFGRD